MTQISSSRKLYAGKIKELQEELKGIKDGKALNGQMRRRKIEIERELMQIDVELINV